MAPIAPSTEEDDVVEREDMLKGVEADLEPHNVEMKEKKARNKKIRCKRIIKRGLTCSNNQEINNQEKFDMIK